MNIKFSELKDKLPQMTGLLFTHPDNQYERATEIWIKFRHEGYYVFINFEQPFNSQISIQKLVGAGNSLNCSDYKKDNEFIQYSEKAVIIEILKKSKKLQRKH